MLNKLVSVIVLTYNSSDYVIETLDSIQEQTYKNIEIIIADDGSKDNTVEKVSNWLKVNADHFPNCVLNASKINTGVSANCNAGLKLANGEWIKLIAGDDILFPECISTFVEYIDREPGMKLYVSKLKYFKHRVADSFRFWPTRMLPNDLNKQIKEQLRGGFIKAPAVLINKELLLKVGGFDEHYKYFEDDPLWLKFLKLGERFCFVPEYLVGYRIHDQAISNGNALGYFNPLFFHSYKEFKEEVIFPEMKNRKMFIWYYLAKCELGIQASIVNRGNSISLIRTHEKLLLLFVRAVRKLLRAIEI